VIFNETLFPGQGGSNKTLKVRKHDIHPPIKSSQMQEKQDPEYEKEDRMTHIYIYLEMGWTGAVGMAARGITREPSFTNLFCFMDWIVLDIPRTLHILGLG
jgi:hypothetical protein